MFVRTDEGHVPAWSFRDRLRKARESAGLEQSDLAALLGKKRSTVSNWERGANRPDELALRAIAYHTGVRYAWLVGEDPDTEVNIIGYLTLAA
jgi:transcriptional regulator with XRE-family HTH domain